jgi:hypothetical protein
MLSYWPYARFQEGHGASTNIAKIVFLGGSTYTIGWIWTNGVWVVL